MQVMSSQETEIKLCFIENLVKEDDKIICSYSYIEYDNDTTTKLVESN